MGFENVAISETSQCNLNAPENEIRTLPSNLPQKSLVFMLTAWLLSTLSRHRYVFFSIFFRLHRSLDMCNC